MQEQEAKEEAKDVACRGYTRVFKTNGGRWKQEAKANGWPPPKEYNCGRGGCNNTTYGAARHCRWMKMLMAKEGKWRVKEGEEALNEEE